VGKRQGRKPLARTRRGFGIDSIDLAQNKDQWRVFVNTVTNLRVAYNVGNLLSSRTTGGFSRRPQLHAVSL
jgi:hypothetical protein